MKTVLVVVCAVAGSAGAPVASQVLVGRGTVDRNHQEALHHYRLGQDALHGERFDDAEREFQQAARLDPTLELAPYGLGQVYMATKRYRRAVMAYQKCRDVFQANAAAAVGNEVARQQRIDERIQLLEDQQRLYQSPGRNANTAAARANIQQLDMQISQMKDLRRRTMSGPDPTPAWISIALGSAYFRIDAMADAEREYRAAIAVAPKLGEAHNNLAVVFMLTERYAEAEEEIKTAEKSGFKVNPQLKDDLKKAVAARR